MRKKLNEQGFHIWVIVVIIVVIAALGFVGWYVWVRNNDDTQTLETSDNSSAAVTPTISTDTVTTTPTTTTTTTQNELDKIRTYCEDDSPNMIVRSIQYVENDYGKFALCGISSADGLGGGGLIAVYQDDTWSKIWEGNGVMDNTLCSQYKIPSSIYADCPGWYE